MLDTVISSNKLDKLGLLIQTHPKEKTIIFCHFSEEIKLVNQQLLLSGIPSTKIGIIEGSVSSLERENILQSFKSHTNNSFLQSHK